MNAPQPKRPMTANDREIVKAAGLMILTKDGRALFIKRSDSSDHSGEWEFPGGMIDKGETPEEAARRETCEETQWIPEGDLEEIINFEMENVDFTAFRTKINNEFIPTLSPREHSGYAWAPIDDPPEPTHPGCKKVLKMELAQDRNVPWSEQDHPRGQPGNAGQFGSGGGSKLQNVHHKAKAAVAKAGQTAKQTAIKAKTHVSEKSKQVIGKVVDQTVRTATDKHFIKSACVLGLAHIFDHYVPGGHWGGAGFDETAIEQVVHHIELRAHVTKVQAVGILTNVVDALIGSNKRLIPTDGAMDDDKDSFTVEQLEELKKKLGEMYAPKPVGDKAKFEEHKHPRGQPGNAGQFGSGGGGKKTEAPKPEKKETPKAPQGGEAKTSGGQYKPGIITKGLDATDAKKKEWAERSSIKKMEDLWGEGSIRNQEALASVSKPLAARLGLDFKDPGIKGKTDKGKACIQEKIDQGKAPNRINDGVRAGFQINAPGQSDAIVNELAKHFEVGDEGWQVTPAGYFDRKVMVRFPDGQVGEVQIWHPDLLEAKEHGGGHKLYEEWRSLPPGDPRISPLVDQMKELYGKVHQRMSPDWLKILGKGASGNLDEKFSFDSMAALVATSILGAFNQRPSRNTSAVLVRWSNMAGSPSHEHKSIRSSGIDVVSRKRGFTNTYAMDEKITKASARYTDGPVDFEPCRRCEMYRDYFCTAVVGEISPNGHCKLWEPDDHDPAMDAAANQATHKELTTTIKYLPPKSSTGERVIDNSFARGGLKQGESLREAPKAVAWERRGGHDEKLSAEELGYTPEVDRAHTVPVMSVLSRDGKIFYIDKSLPDKITNNGRELDVVQPLIHHECAEFAAMQTMMAEENIHELADEDNNLADEAREKIYLKAHKNFGTASERRWIEDNGYDWDEWEAWCRGELDRLEHEEDSNPVPDPDVKPLPHDRRELESNIHAEDSDFEESKHPRDQSGRFGSGGEGESSIENNEGLAYLLGGKSQAGPVGTEKGTIKPNGVSNLKVATAPEGYAGHRLVYAEDGKIVGAMQITKTPSSNYTVANTYVHPDFRRQGIGTKFNEEAKRLFGKLDRSEGPSQAGQKFRESLAGDWMPVFAYDRSILVKLNDGNYIKAPRECMAFDFKSVRTYDRDGRLHVAITNISKAAINPYLGKEIPEWETLGLDPNRIYRLYRDPDELAKAAKTFNSLPLLSEHVAVDADNHKPELVIGSTGTDAVFANPYLKNSLVVWAGPAIEDIESEDKKELSCAYRYRADMRPGMVNGERYDGRMVSLTGNHVALVAEGRAGPDVVIGDSVVELQWMIIERAILEIR
jgi:8-oxo-dGTP pyrophosphatase MutT (NUDIX family)